MSIQVLRILLSPSSQVTHESKLREAFHRNLIGGWINCLRLSEPSSLRIFMPHRVTTEHVRWKAVSLSSHGNNALRIVFTRRKNFSIWVIIIHILCFLRDSSASDAFLRNVWANLPLFALRINEHIKHSNQRLECEINLALSPSTIRTFLPLLLLIASDTQPDQPRLPKLWNGFIISWVSAFNNETLIVKFMFRINHLNGKYLHLRGWQSRSIKYLPGN